MSNLAIPYRKTDNVHVSYWNGFIIIDSFQCKENKLVRLCLKHFRRNDYPEAFEALRKKSRLSLEDSVVERLYTSLVSPDTSIIIYYIICL